MRIHRALIFFVFLAAACASATKRYEQGQQLEQQGRPADAAGRYIETLRKDATYSEARQRLADVGAAAVADYARQTDSLAKAGMYMDAADALRSADALVRDASGVGVALRLPDASAQQHDWIFNRAIDQAISQSAAATGRGDFAESVRLLERARDRWDPPASRQAELNGAAYDAQLAWARSELDAGHFRSAYEHGGTAAAVPGFGRAETTALQAEALRRGTVLVAIFPTAGRPGTDPSVLPELNDQLVLEHWQRPPQWIDAINPIEAQRVVRNRGLAGRELSVQEVTALTRQLGARFGIALTLDSVRYSESKVEKKRVAVRTRAGVDTAYTLEDGQLEAWSRVSWRQVDANGGVASRGDAIGRGTTHFRRATYAGTSADLDLKPADRALFDPRNARGPGNQDLARQVAHDLADKLGRAVFDALLRGVD